MQKPARLLSDSDISAMLTEAQNANRPDRLASHVYTLAVDRKRLASRIAELAQSNSAYEQLAAQAKSILQREGTRVGLFAFGRKGQIDAMRSEIAALVQQNQDLIKTGEQLRRHAQRSQEASTQTRALERDLLIAQSQLQQFQQHALDARNAQERAARLEDDLIQAQSRISDLQNELAEALSRSTNSPAPADDELQARLTELHEELTAANATIVELRSEIVRIKHDQPAPSDAMGYAERTFQLRYNEAMQKLVDMETRLVSTEGNLQDAQNALQRAQQETEAKQQRLDLLQADHDQLLATRSSLQRELDQASSQNERLSHTARDAEQSVQRIQAELIDRQERVRQQDVQLIDLQASLRTLNETIRSTQSELDSAKAELRQSSEELVASQAQVQSLQTQHGKYVDQINDLIGKHEVLERDIRIQEEAHQERLASISSQLTETARALAEVTRQREALQDHNTRMKEVILQQRQVIASTSKARHEFKTLAQELALEVKQKDQALSAQRLEIAALRRQLDEALSMQRVIPFRGAATPAEPPAPAAESQDQQYVDSPSP
ncbi:hypothetical protein [Pseudomonas aeruginosa]|uniref:hypothetical protein n=1 Tax=Pseudomonas aeruginosa TaxID=287 RepID=UPI0007100224|nr:hypothetical protein [Pseudomonas aeruginosa]MCS7987188.1 hypothetical protein [Pseudomonas aeruginosa]MCS9097920.1 hypothetical protein [Pseudomonas aeruginosa]MDG4416975.1 hypothetical protein [Pseudomonas aeruginosa]RPS13062.1 hypothetical protein IPC1015_33855 [Pseudomonas aeruginosa]RUF51731.1 hypothetical protein IPC1130_31040 [Pseudomonas aeruginosa]